ncbi:ComF family protein [Paenibacillus sp. PK3_47]|uniref:ComF family protein n=1 Tax=Paenibacillus sp. PK3_47 TaxID=2072642 RepID=UPI00201E5DDD|nr:ComF family protein [Paenibacillus sp. PK3_47]UQZ33852.1 ComF family protein [Paenibacillus sp. PK3_47]
MLKHIKAWSGHAQALLVPVYPQCLICSKKAPSSPELPEICAGCAATIPWIRKPRCSKCGRHVGCPDCTRSKEEGPIVCNRSAVAYTSEMREMLGQYKYRGNERLALLLGLMLDRAYGNLKEEKESELRSLSPDSIHKPFPRFFTGNRSTRQWQADLLVPVPVSESRLNERGFNQAERLADVLSRRRGIPQLPLLIRTHHTGKQSFKSRAERLNDMKHAFAANPDMNLKERISGLINARVPENRPLQIIIVDDIYTTGSTIRACAETVKQISESYGRESEIYSLTWARS